MYKGNHVIHEVMKYSVPHSCSLQALCALPTSSSNDPLLQQILSPFLRNHPPPPCLETAPLPPSLATALAQRYNPGQQGAIAACLDTACRFTLVQGPPGTGKTSCIMGIVSVLLLKEGGQRVGKGQVGRWCWLVLGVSSQAHVGVLCVWYLGCAWLSLVRIPYSLQRGHGTIHCQLCAPGRISDTHVG